MKREGEKGREGKRKVKVEISISAHVRSSKANVFHLEQTAENCSTRKRCFGQFWLFIVRMKQEKVKLPRANGLKEVHVPSFQGKSTFEH